VAKAVAELEATTRLNLRTLGVVRFRSSLECAAVHEFLPQHREEALRDGVVVTTQPGVLGNARDALYSSSSSRLFGQSVLSKRERPRSAKSLPPVWHFGQ